MNGKVTENGIALDIKTLPGSKGNCRLLKPLIKMESIIYFFLQKINKIFSGLE